MSAVQQRCRYTCQNLTHFSGKQGNCLSSFCPVQAVMTTSTCKKSSASAGLRCPHKTPFCWHTTALYSTVNSGRTFSSPHSITSAPQLGAMEPPNKPSTPSF